jgi:hypothetical protein
LTSGDLELANELLWFSEVLLLDNSVVRGFGVSVVALVGVVEFTGDSAKRRNTSL